MKVAIAKEGQYVSQHFGYSEGFMLYEIEEDKIVKEDFVKNPGHRPGFLPNFIKDLGVNLVIAGGMGEVALQLFAENNIEVIVGAEGFVDDVIQLYLKKELKSTGHVCR